MTWVIWTVKTLLLPGSVQFLLLGVGLGTLLLYGSERHRKWGRRWLAALVAGYWLLSVPHGAGLVVGAMRWGYRPIASASEAQGATAVIVLDASTLRFRATGGAIDTVSAPSAYRAIEGGRIYRLLGEPFVFVSGGSDAPQLPSSPEAGALRSELVRAGVPQERIVMETGSDSTRAQALNLARLLRTRRIKRAVLVTSPTHIVRATRTFRAVGLDVVPSPSGPGPEGDPSGVRTTPWWPSPVYLRLSEDGLRDAMAIVYYWARGWLRTPDAVPAAQGSARLVLEFGWTC